MTWLSLLLFVYLAIVALCLADGLTARAAGRLPMTVTLTNIFVTALCAPALLLLILVSVAVAAAWAVGVLP